MWYGGFMDRCKYCKEYHHEFKVCNGYIDNLKEEPMDKLDWNTLFDMKLGEIFIPDNNSIIRRVPGGWVYGDMHGVCFIPFVSRSYDQSL